MNNKFTSILILVLLSALISRMINNIILTITPVIARTTYRIPLSNLGIVETIILLSIIISMFSVNLIYSRKILVFSFLLLSLSLLLLDITNIYLFFLSLIAAGLAFGIIIPSMTTISSSITEDQNTNVKSLKLYTLGLSIGAVTSSILEAIATSLKAINLLLAALSLLNFFNIYFYLKFYNRQYSKLKLSLTIILNKKLWMANLISLPYDVPIAFINVYLVLFSYYYYHVSIPLGFLLFFIYLSISTISRYFIYKLNISEKGMKVYSAILTILGATLLIIPNPIFLSISVILLGIPHGLLLPLSNLIIAKEFKNDKEKNFANSLNLLFHYIVFIVVPLILGIFIKIGIFYGLLVFIIMAIGSSFLLFLVKI